MTIINLQQKGYTVAHWFFCVVQASKEMAVQKDLRRQTIEVYVPLTVKSITVSRRAKKTRSKELALLPRLVFIKCAHEQLLLAQSSRFVDRVARNATGEALSIPTPQMVQFTAYVEEAFKLASRAISEGKQVKAKKQRTLKLEELRDADVLESVMAEMFGIETTAEEAA